MGSLFLLQQIFLTQELNQGLLHCRQILYCMSHEDSPKIMSIHWRFCILNVPHRILLCNAMVVSLVQLHHPVMSDFCNPMDCSTPGFLSITNSQSLLKLTSIESVMPSNHLILCHPLLLLPSIFPSIRIFYNESVLCIMPKNWSFSFSISLSNEYSGLISFRIDWLDVLVVQRTLKSLLQHHI